MAALKNNIRVNSTDYDGEIVVELFDYHSNGECGWHVPAWAERSYGKLAGPFDSVEQAQAQIEYVLDMFYA
jgi:hypothetical protein